LVTLTSLVLLGALLARFHAIVPLLVLAGILAYLMLPTVRLLHHRARLTWSGATHVSFLYLILLFVVGLTALGLGVVQQLQALFGTVQRSLVDLPQMLADLTRQPLILGPWQIDFSRLDLVPGAQSVLSAAQPLLGRASSLIASLATGALGILARAVFVLAVAYFVTIDFERLHSGWSNLSLPGYEEDLGRLRRGLERIWQAFLRGQMLIVVLTGILTGTAMTLMGVRFSVGLGVLAGMAKFVPILGPFTAGAVAALVALLQPTHWFGLSPVGHALVVVLTLVLLDQAVDYLLVPRVMGSSLNLHPIVILVGAIVAASLAGILGLLLSAPSVASIILIGRYAYRKIFDLSPWDPPIDAPAPARLPALGRLVRRGRSRTDAKTGPEPRG
jgi:predicted PurR-regulated permease PerM